MKETTIIIFTLHTAAASCISLQHPALRMAKDSIKQAAFPRKRPCLSQHLSPLRIAAFFPNLQSVATNHCSQEAAASPREDEEMNSIGKRGFLRSQMLPVIKKGSRGAWKVNGCCLNVASFTECPSTRVPCYHAGLQTGGS